MKVSELEEYDVNNGIQGITDITIHALDGDLVVCIFYSGEYGQNIYYPIVYSNSVEGVLPNGIKVEFSLDGVYFDLLKELQHRICSLQEMMSQVL